jgi:uncharacterized membrane-anchored protein
MKHSRSTAGASSVSGVVRVGHDPRTLSRRLRKGDIAIIDKADLDAASAEMLADRSPGCIINASPSITGRFQSRGAERLAARGVTLVDVVDRAVLAATDGETITIDLAAAEGGATVAIGGTTFEGVIVDSEYVKEHLAAAMPGAGLRVPHLAASALDLIHRDGPALVEGRSVPDIELDLSNRDALVVTAGPGFRLQLKALKRAIRDLNLVVVVTGDAADAVAEDHRIDVIVGPLDGVSDEVLAGAKEVVVHGESLAVAATRLGSLGVRHVASESRLSSEDLAVAIAASAGARMIATVGIESSLADLVDSHRGASSVLARLAAGPAWIDGRMLARLHRSPWSRLQRWLMIFIAAASLAAALSLHPVVRAAVERLVGGS